MMCIVLGTAACWATMTACDSIDLNAIDWDGDGVSDVTDAFPVDPREDTDSDGDGVGDNSDAFPTDPSRSETATVGDSGETDSDTANANDNSSDESPPPDVNPPPTGGGGRRKTRN